MRRILAGAITAACISSAAGPNAAAAHATAAEGAAEAASAQTGAMSGDARGRSKRPPMAGASRVCERQMAQAAAKHGVPLGMLYAVGLTESGNRGSLQPYAMNIGGKAYFGATAADVVQRLTQAQQEGVRLVDLGCMQINHHYHRAKFASLEAMIDPAQNVEYATRFLKELKEREEAGRWRSPAIMPGRTTTRRRRPMSAGSSPTWSPPASATGRRAPRHSASRQAQPI
ncbi:hypothetical protein GCM10025880_34410 [Methylorubrum aminovorans]|nr:hypothetical protein GCM10025880_34410 [Methylorubrum aminovorans]